MSPLNAVLGDVWRTLYARERQALCSLSYSDDLAARLSKGFVPWSDLSVDDRMRLIRAMRAVSVLAATCAAALDGARVEIERAAPPTPRESLVNHVADVVGIPPARLVELWERSARRR